MRHYRRMTRTAADSGRAAVSGVLAAAAGLATSELLSGYFHLRVSPVGAVAESVIRLTPGSVVEFTISRVGRNDKPLVIVSILVVLGLISAATGLLARRSRMAAEAVFALMGVVLLVSVHSRLTSGDIRYLPAVVGVSVAMLLLSALTTRASEAAAVLPGGAPAPAPMQAASRRSFLRLAAVVAAGSVAAGSVGRVLAHGREKVEAARTALAGRFTTLATPRGVGVGVDGVTPWVTSAADFYRIDTSFSVPLIAPHDWELRIHGLVDTEITLTYDDLLARGLTEAWLTLCCVSNEVGGSLIGNAAWSGVRLAPLLAEAAPHTDADAVLSRSADGWTAGTPLGALTDDRNAMLAVAMNGSPLTPEHGFPVRMVVPGLYGYVSATKWVVDLEVTRFSDFTAFWTQRGWSPQGPVKTQSRIDVPGRSGRVAAGTVMVAGVAWAQHRGITRVEVQVDDEPWAEARLAADPTIDSWRQWSYAWQAAAGSHRLRVRATDGTGTTQTEKIADVVPDGATGWDTITVDVS